MSVNGWCDEASADSGPKTPQPAFAKTSEDEDEDGDVDDDERNEEDVDAGEVDVEELKKLTSLGAWVGDWLLIFLTSGASGCQWFVWRCGRDVLLFEFRVLIGLWRATTLTASFAAEATLIDSSGII